MVERGELVERLEKATGPSDELDARILCLLAAPKDSYVEQSRFNGKWCIFEPKSASGKDRLWEYRGGWFRPDGWPVTASLEAAIALVERVLPGWGYLLEWRDDGFVLARLVRNLNNIPDEKERARASDASGMHRSYTTTLPIALLIALLKAGETQ